MAVVRMASDDGDCQHASVSSAKSHAPRRSYGGISAAERITKRRELLLDAALELYGTRGFVATGVKDICRQAGVTDRYFYESFRDSAELFTATYDRAAHDLLVLVAERVAAAPADPVAQVRAAIETFVRALTADRRLARVLFVETAAAGAAAERHVRVHLRRFAELVAATAEPHLPAATEPRMIRMGALSLVGAIERVVTEWQNGYLETSVTEMTDYLVGLFLAAGAVAGLSTGESETFRRPR
jgi:AcrR family transcriptional regulator